jgi:hypothetical protein
MVECQAQKRACENAKGKRRMKKKITIVWYLCTPAQLFAFCPRASKKQYALLLYQLSVALQRTHNKEERKVTTQETKTGSLAKVRINQTSKQASSALLSGRLAQMNIP